MPTLKPRIAVTLNQGTYDVIARLAELQECSRGAVVAELLEAVAPALGRTVALLEAAAEAPKQVHEGLRSVIEGTHDDLLSALGDGFKQMDFLLSELSGGKVDPHVVTRGSGSGGTGGATQRKKPSKPDVARVPAKKAASKRTGGKDAGKKRSI